MAEAAPRNHSDDYALHYHLHVFDATNSFKLFDQNFALTAGAPMKKTAMLALDIYNTFYGRIGDEGVGQAKAVLFFLMVAAIAALQLRATRSREVEQ